jgi:hypothetical protein
MRQPISRFGSNIGLLDARGTAQILYSLSARYSAVEFADFCTVAEELVIRDAIVAVGQVEKFPKHLRVVLRPLFDAGIFINPEEAFQVPDLPSDPRQLRASALAIERGLTTATVDDATFEARRLLGGEAHYGIVATPLLRQLQHFGLVRRPAIENTVWDLASQYRKLSMDALALRSRFQSCAGLPQISLPPVALRAIQRSKTFEGILAEVFELRREFAPLRNHLRSIEERLSEGRLAPTQSLELENTWRLKWQRIADSMGPATNSMAMARTSLPMLQDGLKIVKGIVSKNPMDIVTTTVGWINPGFEALGRLQLRPVHRSVSNYLNTTDRELVGAVARIFETDFLRLDRDMRSLAYQQGSPWRLALNDSASPDGTNHTSDGPRRVLPSSFDSAARASVQPTPVKASIVQRRRST